MSSFPILLIFFLICGVSSAAFAADRNRGQARWFVIGLLTGPVGLLILLLLPSLGEPQRSVKMKKAILALFATVLIVALVAFGFCEFYDRYEQGARHTSLDNWQVYGDALLRFTKSTEHPPDAIVVKAARNQIEEYEYQLRQDMCWTMDDIELAMEGVRHSKGARALLANGYRLLTLRGVEWPARIQMNANEQSARIAELSARFAQYEVAMNAIEAARPAPATTTSGG